MYKMNQLYVISVNYLEFCRVKNLKYFLGVELREIQKQIENFFYFIDFRIIVDFLVMRRDVMFLEFDIVVRYCMMDIFFFIGNVQLFYVSVSYI